MLSNYPAIPEITLSTTLLHFLHRKANEYSCMRTGSLFFSNAIFNSLQEDKKSLYLQHAGRKKEEGKGREGERDLYLIFLIPLWNSRRDHLDNLKRGDGRFKRFGKGGKRSKWLHRGYR